MIKGITLLNFQSHKKTTLKFDPGVNVIIGPSDSGKTSIIRALRWLIWNRPTGDSFRSTWGGETNVGIHITNDGKELQIVRAKNKGANQYGLDEQVFNAFGADVPDEIKKLLNITETNLQQQLDSPFLLSESAGEVAQHFNQVAHLDQIDEGLRKVQHWIREIEQDIKNKERQVEENQEKLKQYEHLDAMEIEVEVLEDMQSRMLQKINNRHSLSGIAEQTIDVNTTIKKESTIIPAEQTVNKVLQLYTDKQKTEDKTHSLQRLVEKIQTADEEIEQYRQTTEMEPVVKSILQTTTKKIELSDVSLSMQKLINGITGTEKRLLTALKHLKTIENEFHKAIDGEICPLCGQMVKV